MGWLFVVVGIVGILFARRITQRVVLLRLLAVFILLTGIVLTAPPPEPTKTSGGAPSPVAEPPSAQQPEVKVPRGIGRSYDQIASFPSEVFPRIESSPLRDGRPRTLLSTTDHLATLEVIGAKDNPVEASLSLFIPNDAPVIVAKHSLLALAFLANIAPEWEERNAWATEAMWRAAEPPEREETTVYAGRRITVRFLKPLSMIQILVSPG